MPQIVYKDCTIEDELASAVLEAEERMGEDANSILAAIDGLELGTESDQVNDVLDQMSLQAPSPTDPNDLALSIGNPPLDPDEIDDESRLEALGIIMIKGIAYLASGTGNIDAYRRLYFALGGDTTTFLEVLRSGEKLVVVQTRLMVKVLPNNPRWTVDEARTAFSNEAIEEVYTAGDSRFYCVVPTFLGYNRSKQQVSREFNVPEEEIVTQSFWFGGTEQTPTILNKLALYGITGDQIAATLLGERLVDLRPNLKESLVTDASVKTNIAIEHIDIFKKRFNTLDPNGKNIFLGESNGKVVDARLSWQALSQLVYFYVTDIARTQDIEDFLVKNTEAHISYLFTKRRTVSGINFLATEGELLQKLQQALSASSGSTVIASALVNRQIPLVDSDVNYANERLVRNTCALSLLVASSLTYTKLFTARTCLEESLQPQQTPIARIGLLKGYPSFDSAASIIGRRMDFALTFNFDNTLASIFALTKPLSKALQAVMAALLRLLNTAKKLINLIFAKLRAVTNKYVSKIQAMLSRYLSFFGTATIDTSILKCALGYNLLPEIPFLNELDGLIDQLRRTMVNALAKVAKIISDLITKLLCAPLNYINGFITKAEDFLPQSCRAARVELPQELEDALLKFRNSCQFESTAIQQYSKDLIRIRVTTQSLPLKLNQFRESMICNSKPDNRFFKAANNVTKLGTGGNPNSVISGATQKLPFGT